MPGLAAAPSDKDLALALHPRRHSSCPLRGAAGRRCRDCKTGQFLGDLHHLFLVKNDAIGIAENRLSQRMGVLDRCPLPCLRLMYSIDHAGHPADPGPIEWQTAGDDVVEAVGLGVWRKTALSMPGATRAGRPPWYERPGAA